MSDWASKAVDKFADEQNAEESREHRAAQKRTILEEQGPMVWAEIRQLLQGEIKDFNQRAGKEILAAPLAASEKLTVFLKADYQREMTASMSKDYSVAYSAKGAPSECPDHMGKFTMVVNKENTVDLIGPGGQQKSNQDVTGIMLDALMAWKK